MFKYYLIHNLEEYRKTHMLNLFEKYDIDLKDVKIIEHPNKEKYPNQKILLLNFNDYIYAVPYVEDKQHIFLKTIFPTRKMTKEQLKKR